MNRWNIKRLTKEVHRHIALGTDWLQIIIFFNQNWFCFFSDSSCVFAPKDSVFCGADESCRSICHRSFLPRSHYWRPPGEWVYYVCLFTICSKIRLKDQTLMLHRVTTMTVHFTVIQKPPIKDCTSENCQIFL